MIARNAICAFCQRPGVKMSDEHVIPQWMSLLGADAGPYEREVNGRTVRSKKINIITRSICKDCNTGWMSRIEDGASIVMKPIFNATATKISELDRWVIARWITKTVYTFLLASLRSDESEPLDRAQYRNFYINPQPATNQLTLLAGYTGPLLPVRFELTFQDDQTKRAGRILFHFHRVVICVFFLDNDYPSVHLPTWLKQAAHVIWPPQRDLLWNEDPTMPVSWPPPYLLDEAAINNLCDVMRGDATTPN